MTVFVFGNPDLPFDSLPLRLLPALKREFPNVNFVVRDPNEDWEVPAELILIDTVEGINKVSVLTDLDEVTTSPHLTLHDFDVGLHLKYLKKLGKLKQVTIIGLPPTLAEAEALPAVVTNLRANLP
ncbi:MAG: hypothetical protein HY974_01395 [Candidatus Kerfeldbacteria bacterium]|nr:hypothetical protein [Candidatus Kerfeldbacteria bacterium]